MNWDLTGGDTQGLCVTESNLKVWLNLTHVCVPLGVVSLCRSEDINQSHIGMDQNNQHAQTGLRTCSLSKCEQTQKQFICGLNMSWTTSEPVTGQTIDLVIWNQRSLGVYG